MKLKTKESLCNMCGESCKLTGSQSDIGDEGGLIEQTVHGGYDSTPGNGVGALDDSTSYTFSICEFCLDWLFTQFVIPPAVFDYILGVQEPFVCATKRVTQDDWRRNKQEFYAESARRSDLRNEVFKLKRDV